MILNIYKENGWTSFDVVAKIKNLFKIKKVGHAGTLDPLAEGVLVVLTGSDTKKQSEIMAMEKEYIADIGFGIVTPTYDVEINPEIGEKVPSIKDLDRLLPDLIGKYRGEIDQKAPPYSAKKVRGKRLYKMSRKGVIIAEDELPVKRITIYSIDIFGVYYKSIEISGQVKKIPSAKLRVVCSSGTYLRSLANDLGKDLGSGAVLIDLVRTRVGYYKVEDSVKISDLKL